MGRDARNAKRTAENYYAANPVQKCIVCGRMFIRRRDNVCSIACQQKAEATKGVGNTDTLTR